LRWICRIAVAPEKKNGAAWNGRQLYPLPKGKGVIGGNGFGLVSFDLKKLGKEEVYLKVTTSDRADFAKPRVTPKPPVLAVEQVKIKDRGLKEKIKQTEIEEWRPQGEPF